MVIVLALIIYLVFLVIFIALNAWIISRVMELKIEGDKSELAIYILLGSIVALLLTTFTAFLFIYGSGV